MKIKNISTVSCLSFIAVSVLFIACDTTTNVDIENGEEYNNVYMPQAVDIPAENTIILKDEVQQILYGAAFGGPGSPGNNLNIDFAFSPAMADSFNINQGTDYPVIPEETVNFGELSGVIPAGELATDPLRVGINPMEGLELDQPYLLPISISNISGETKMHSQMHITYFKIIVEANFFDRSSWEIVDVSSEETIGEGEGNGGAQYAIDGDKSTYWHTAWYDSQPDYPHHITVDIQEEETITGFQLTNRQGDTRGMTRIRFEGSLDGEAWTNLGEFEFKQIDETQKFITTSNPEIRYLKLVALEGPNFFTALAEIEAF